MSRPHDKAILNALGEPGRGAVELTFTALLDETGLHPAELNEALWRLVRNNAVKILPGGRYKAIDTRHSKAVRRGLFVKGIPTLVTAIAVGCGYVAASYPVVEQANAILWRVM
jgi:hypothetical protein